MASDGKRRKPGLVPNLYAITLLYFALGFVSIHFGMLALACMSIPFILLSASGKKLWCHHYCPRSSLTTRTGSKRKNWRPLPKSFTDGFLRKMMLWYFGMNLLFIAGSTIQVAMGRMSPMPYVRLFIAVPLWPLPQLLENTGPAWLLHLSYRLYSMMLSSTILGIAFSRIWRPRAWCAVCPVGTLLNKHTHP
ncbi:MAG: 4Fe-4S binding protein [Sphaerochaeta sp.]|jgi:polyferredoxin|nr:4Fe-4S binding protein [Sphaerochaeta sp.]PKL27118.1 MAG: hypothetical protein CVV46_13100 [Spirochaetae bacterium HGW-Spirochaetae-2]